MSKFLVVGAGLSGCVISSILSKNLKAKIDLVEKRNHVAGNCYDTTDTILKDNNQILLHKYGPHIFHTNSVQVWDFLSDFCDWEPFFPNVKTVIYGKEISLPFNLNSIYDIFGTEKARKYENLLCSEFKYGESIPIYELLQINNSELKELAQFIFDNVFKNYVVKQWGTAPEQIDPSIMKRVPINISRNDSYFNDRYQAIPQCGYTNLLKNMINRDNINLILNTDYKDFIKLKLNKEDYVPDDIKHLEYDAIFVTSSIDEFFNFEFGVLPYRSLRFRDVLYERKSTQKGVVVSYPNNFDFTRVTEHKKFYPNNLELDYSISSYEYSENFELGKNERFYPILNEENTSLYNKYLNKIGKNSKIYFLGRLGDYKYYNMDIAIERCFQVISKFKENNSVL